jgi:hypothetical protein
VGFAVCYLHKTGDIAAQIHKRVKLDCPFVATAPCPGEQSQAEIDCRRIQSVCGLLQLDAETIGSVQPPGMSNQNLGEVGVDGPIATFVGPG